MVAPGHIHAAGGDTADEAVAASAALLAAVPRERRAHDGPRYLAQAGGSCVAATAAWVLALRAPACTSASPMNSTATACR